MIVIRLSGGLGNQMFQYALFIRLRKQYPTQKIKFYTNSYKKTLFHNGLRIAEIYNLQELKRILPSHNILKRIYYGIESVALKTLLPRILGKNYIIEDLESFTNRVDEMGNDSLFFVDGSMGSEKYFFPVKGDVKKRFRTFNVSMSNICIDICSKIKDSNSVLFHVRRGDYLKNSCFVDLTQTSYYEDAVSYLEDVCIFNNLVYYVFSDDIEWCKNNMKILFGKNVVYVSNLKDYEDLYLMQNCKYAITANSSFSWWGAYLSEASIVICPKNKLKEGLIDKPIDILYPTEWIKL